MAFPTSHNSRPSHSSNVLVPPSLPRRQCIPLPQLSDVETEINPLLANGIGYNIRASPSFAYCPARRHSSQGREAWRYEPAIYPNIPSLTIYLDFDLDRPIVVFPANSYGAVITIAHVLAAVNHRVTAMGDALRRAYAAGYSVQLLRREVYWAGLVPSSTERDVWVLQTR